MWVVYAAPYFLQFITLFFCVILCLSAPSKKKSNWVLGHILPHTLFSLSSASAYADIQWEQPHQPRNPDRDPFGYPHREIPPLASYAPQPDYMTGDDDLIKPKKLINPVKASKSHQELHRELLMNHKRYEDTQVYST